VTLVDSHCHLDDKQFDEDRDAAVERALAAGVQRMLAIGTGQGPPDLSAAIRLADQYPPIVATVGIHPEHAARARDDDFAHLRELAAHPKVVAIGEIGLDYYWQPFDKDAQHRTFIQQMEIASDAAKPVTIHTRDAWDDTLALLEAHWDAKRLACILHCFSGGPEIAERALRIGCYLSFAGVVTYPKAIGVQESARMAPLDRILVETDAPYLAPVPKRGKRNEPAYVAHTAAKLAELRGCTVEDVAAATTATFNRIAGVR
jgi:TatD DNase family protein